MAFRESFCGTRWVVPSGQDSSILPTRVANQSAGFDSLPAQGTSHEINRGTVHVGEELGLARSVSE